VYAWQLDGDSISFTLTDPSPGEEPALTASDDHGNPLVTVSTVNIPDEQVYDPKTGQVHEITTVKGATASLIDAWNQNPIAANIALATGESAISLFAIHPNTPLHVRASIAHRVTGDFSSTPIVLSRPEFANLPDIHFKGRTAPDFMIRFGSNSESGDLPRALDLLASRGIHYELLDTIHLNWKDLYRPERIWRSFVTLAPQKGDEIYVYRRRD
jgi:hypothetical protein